MEIRGVDGVRGIDNNSKVNKVNRKSDESVQTSDTAEISSEAKQLAEEAKIKTIIDKAPDVREEKLQEIKQKLENGDYNKEEVINKLADRLMKVLGY